MNSPQLYIDGDLVDDTIQQSTPTALAGLEIIWGASTIWEHPDPTTLTVQLIDPTGVTLDAAWIGKTIEVRHPNHGAIFLGRIATAPARERTIFIDGQRRDVWERTITAKDPTSLLSRRAIGPSGGAWPLQSADTRIAALLTQIDDPLVTEIKTNPSGNLRAYAADEEVSILDMLRRNARADLGSVLSYDPRNRRIASSFVDVYDVGLSLSYIAGVLLISTANAFPASDFRILERTFDLTVEDAIDQVRIDYVDEAGLEVETIANTTRYSPQANGVRVAEFETDSVEVVVNDFVRDRIAASIGNLADRLTAPAIRWRGAELPDPLAITSVADDTFLARHQTLHIYGSKWAHLQASGRQYMVGGRLSWDGEFWQHDLELDYHPEPALGDGYVTITTLVTNPAAPLSSFDPSINLGTLGWVQFGAA